MTVTASIFPLADIVRKVGGEHVEVDVFIPPGASPHVFEPSPEVYRRFRQTRLFVMVGAGMEFWAEKLIEANARKDLRVIRATDGVGLIQMAETDQGLSPPGGRSPVEEHPGERLPSDQENSGSEHRHETGNPHVWLDPVLMDHLAERICQALIDLDPDRAAEYTRNLTRFRKQLAQLHQTIQKTVAEFRIKEYVAFHPAWSYFARRYGLREVGIIQQSPGRDPTPKQIEEIIGAIERYHIKAVFAEPQFNPSAAEAVAQEADVEVLILDPLGGPELPGRDSYIGLMYYNLGIMREAMQ
jgi:zinc transport system substrate-binding protein